MWPCVIPKCFSIPAGDSGNISTTRSLVPGANLSQIAGSYTFGLFGFDDLIAYLTTFATLKPGDLIATGTPTGAGARFDPPRWLVPGDVVEIASPGIGILRNHVVDEG